MKYFENDYGHPLFKEINGAAIRQELHEKTSVIRENFSTPKFIWGVRWVKDDDHAAQLLELVKSGWRIFLISTQTRYIRIAVKGSEAKYV